MDIQQYRKLKAAGLVKLVRVGNSHAYELRRFDPNFGNELDPEIGAISRADLEKKLAELQVQMDSIKELMADLPEKS